MINFTIIKRGDCKECGNYADLTEDEICSVCANEEYREWFSRQWDPSGITRLILLIIAIQYREGTMIIKIVEDNEITEEQKQDYELTMRIIAAMKANNMKTDFNMTLKINSMTREGKELLAKHLGILWERAKQYNKGY